MIEEPKIIIDVTAADGKYRVILKEGVGLHALRHGKPWRDCCGDNLVYFLALELHEARERIEALKNETMTLGDALDNCTNTIDVLKSPKDSEYFS